MSRTWLAQRLNAVVVALEHEVDAPKDVPVPKVTMTSAGLAE